MIDQQCGVTHKRSQLKKMLSKLKPDDTVMVKEISHLGCCTREAIETIETILNMEVTVEILDMKFHSQFKSTQDEVFLTLKYISGTDFLPEKEVSIDLSEVRRGRPRQFSADSPSSLGKEVYSFVVDELKKSVPITHIVELADERFWVKMYGEEIVDIDGELFVQPTHCVISNIDSKKRMKSLQHVITRQTIHKIKRRLSL